MLLLLSVGLTAAQETPTPAQGTPTPAPTLDTEGEFRVVQVLPNNGAVGIKTDADITVIFNRPVVPLGIVEDADMQPQPLTFTPAVDGQGEWLNTSIYVFHPAPALAGGTEYSVTVDGNLTAADGSTLAEPFTWSFTTAAPSISEVVPTDGETDVRLDKDIEVRFNQPMDQASVEASFRLQEQDSEAAIPGSFVWAEDGSGFLFDPDDSLEIATDYAVDFANPPLPVGGGAPLEGQMRWVFSTVPLPAIVSTDPFDGQTDAYPDGGFTIFFASPMNPDTLEDHISVEPEPFRVYDSYYSDYNNSYTLSFASEPSTQYTVTISPGMEDVYGNTIDQELVVNYTTAPYDPDVSLQVPGDVGFYNSENPETQLFLTHRNVSEIDLSLYSVALEDFIGAATGEEYYNIAANIPTGVSNLLRRWTIPSVAPLDARRYELLNLGDTTLECPGALESHLYVGANAIVVSQPDPVRARASAPDGEILEVLYKDYALSVIGGPVCANDMLWWEVTLRDGSSAWVAEGMDDDSTNERFLELRGQEQNTPVALTQADGDALIPGIYLLNATSPETEAIQQAVREHVMIVANANLTLKLSVDSLLVWATEVNTGEVIANAPIQVYDRFENVVAEGTTDADGLLSVEIPRMEDLNGSIVAVLQTESQFGIGVSQWSDGIDAYYFGLNANYYPNEYQVYLYTERPIYRPDQPVYFRGVIRAQDDVTYTLPDMGTIPVRIVDDQFEVVYEEELPLTPYGTFSGTFQLAADAPLGSYRIVPQLPGEEPDSYYSMGSIGFDVAEYRAPEFQVELTAQTPEVVQGDTINVDVDSTYFFGGSVANASVTYTVTANPYVFDYQGDGYYSFADFNSDADPGEFYTPNGGVVTEGEGTTDANGHLLISFPADLQDATMSQTFTIEAVVVDESDQAVTGRTDVIVHQGLLYVGVQPEEYVATMGEETAINLIAVDWESQPIPDQPIDIEVVERRWSSVQEKDERRRTVWTYEVEEIPVTTGDVVTDANGEAVYRFTPPNGGIFKITATTRDEDGNEIKASNTVWVSSREYVSWRQQNSNRIDLVADAQDYQVGDTAEILITSPFQGTTEALVTVERGDVLTTDRITLENNSYVYSLPITEDFAPNVFVSVVIVKGVDETNPVAGFRMGLVQLNVDNSQKVITLDISTDVEQAGPGDTVEYTITATDYAGNPVEAEVGVSLTDLAVLTIADPNSGPILNTFYGQQGLSVRTATPLTINTDQITQTVLDTIKGGGGGFGEGGIFDIRQEFVDTPYWNATLTTDENGVATFSVTLPDNLTTWRLDARAVTDGADGNMLVGQATSDLLSTKPLLIRPVTPRFFVVGDEVVLGAVLNNNSDEELDVDVSLQAEGVTFADDDATQTVTILAGQSVRVNWRVTVDEVSTVDLTFFANGGDEFNDASKPPLGEGDDQLLPVYRYEAPETVGTGGTLREAGEVTESIALPTDIPVTDGELTVRLDPSLAATALDSLDYFENYDVTSTEAIVSRFLPNVMTYRALETLDLENDQLSQQLEFNVTDAVQRLYARQQVDGGWGWFLQDSSDPLMTAYVLVGLTEAQEQGFNVSDTVLQNARNFLRGSFVTPELNVETWRLNRQAFVLYMLARSGDPDVARTTTLFESRDRLSYYAKGFLAQALSLIDPEDTSRTDVLLSDLLNGAVTSATGVHWNEESRDTFNWNTDTRTTAIALDTFVKLQPDNELIPNIVRYLMTQREADAWETTQETAWAVMALTGYMRASGELNPDYTYSAVLNGETLTEGAATAENQTEVLPPLVVEVSDLLADEANSLVISRGEGNGVLYYAAHLRVFLPVPQIEPLDRGLIIERHYTMPGSDEPITSARVGENVEVHLTVIAPNDLHYVVIEDPIPAGTDAVNPALNTSQQTGTETEINREDDPLTYGWGWWYFSNIEFRDEKVVMTTTYLPAGTYEYVYTIRAGLAGGYNVIPPTGSEAYFPEVYGRGAGMLFTIEAEES